MIIRISDIRVKRERLNDFLQEYRLVKDAFLNSSGCVLIRLLQDTGNPLTFKMLVQWASEPDKKAFQEGGGMDSWMANISDIVVKPNIYRYFDEL